MAISNYYWSSITILIWRILLSTQTDDLDLQNSDAKGVSAFTTGQMYMDVVIGTEMNNVDLEVR